MNPIDWTKPAADILQELLAIVERRLPLSEAWATGARGLRDFGAGGAGWGGMLAKLEQIGFGDVAAQMVSGLDFGDPQVQAMITQLGTIEPDTFTPERVEILRSWGVDRRPRWTMEGFASQPTLGIVEFEASRRIAIDDTGKRINRASEARRKAIDNAESTGDEITTATEEAFG
jgi:hypothetical protein